MTGVETPQDAPRRLQRTVSASRAGMITTFLTLVNVALGFGFQSMVAARLGLTQASDDFQFAWSIVTFGTVVFFTLVPILLVPRLEDPLTRTISVGDWPKFLILGCALCVAQIALAAFCGPELGEILRWSAASHVFASLTVIPQTTAYIRKRFVAAGIGPAVNGAALLLSFLWIGAGDQPAGLGGALAIGYLFQMLVVAGLAVRRARPFSTRGQIPMRLFLFLLAFTLLSKFQPLLERFLSMSGPTGATATLGFGQKIAQGLLLFAAFGLALTANATLARKVKAGDLDGASELLAKTVVTTSLFSAAVVLAVLPVQHLVIQVLFVRGQFTLADAQAVSDVLLSQIPWVVTCAVTGSLTSYLYIERNYGRVAAAALIGLAGTFLASNLLQPVLPLVAVPIASSFGATVTLAWVAYLVVRSPIWSGLKGHMETYRPLVLASSSAMVFAYALTVATRFAVGSDLLAINVLIALIFIGLAVCVRTIGPLWVQCRRAIGGRL